MVILSKRQGDAGSLGRWVTGCKHARSLTCGECSYLFLMFSLRMLRGPLLLQKVHAKDILKAKQRGTIRKCIGHKLKGSFLRGSFLQRGAGSYWCPWGMGLRARSGGGGVGVFLLETKEKGEVGGGRGPAKVPASQCVYVCQNYPLAIYLLVPP